MTTNEKALDVLERHGMTPESVDPDVCIFRMLADMRSGLAGEACSMDMIPTYLSNDGHLPPEVQAAVIDAGLGTDGGLRRYIEANIPGAKGKRMLCCMTHTHPDHVGGCVLFTQRAQVEQIMAEITASRKTEA